MRDPVPLWRRRAAGALALFAPASCAGCRQPLPPAGRPGRRQAVEGPAPYPTIDALCPTCEAHLDLLVPDQAIALTIASPLRSTHACFAYAGPGADWLRRFKGPGGGLSSLDPDMFAFIDAVALRMLDCAPPPDRIIPVPMHARQLRERGFNSAGRFGQALARLLGVRLDARSLVKVRRTKPQKGLGLDARRRNVENAYALRAQPDPSRLPASIWLVDDVVTTGATLAACARSLRGAGVSQIVGVCVAHTPQTRRNP